MSWPVSRQFLQFFMPRPLLPKLPVLVGFPRLLVANTGQSRKQSTGVNTPAIPSIEHLEMRATTAHAREALDPGFTIPGAAVVNRVANVCDLSQF
jgi:hypothetical protein